MGSKFVIFTYLSKYFVESTYGVYSLLTTTITVSIFILGFDFYNYSIRDILIEKKDTSAKVFSSLVFYFGIYLVFILAGYLIFNQIDYFSKYTGVLILICITEHLNQEMYRLLLAFKKVLLANTFLFIRVTGWTFLVLFLIIVQKENITLNDILTIWAFFNVGTLVLTALFFTKTIVKSLRVVRIKKEWLLRGLKISLIFYAATIALKIIEYSNRYIVEGVLDEVSAGIFSFYSNISMIIGIYVSTIVVSYELPDLIESSITDQFDFKLKRFKKLLIQHSSIAMIVVLLAIYPVLIWQGKESFITFWPLILLLNAGMFLMNISLIYHAYLYIKHREKKILEIVLISSVVNIITTYVFCKYFGIMGAGFAFLITGILIFILRRAAIKRRI